MADGDAAAAAGLHVYTGLELANTIHVLLNQRGDEIAARSTSIQVHGSVTARDTFWGIPADETARLTLQNKGATTVRTDTGTAERYYATYNATTNPGGRTPAGWYEDGAPVVGPPIVLEGFFTTRPTVQALRVERLPGYRAHLSGSVVTASTVSIGADTDYVLGTLPIGWRPAITSAFAPAIVSVAGVIPAFVYVHPDGTIHFAQKTAGTFTADGWIIGIDVTFDLPGAAEASSGLTPGGITQDYVTFTFSKSGTLTTGAGTFRQYNDTGRTLTITSIRASVGTAPTGASVLVDVNLNGTTLFTTQANRPTIAVSTNTATGTPAVTAWPTGGYLTVDVDQIGSTIAGSDLTVTVTAR